MKTSMLHIREVAARSGVSVHTLRYYERMGLVPRADRSPSGYRLYAAEAVRRVRLVRVARWAFQERLCCPFFDVGVRLDREGGPLRLVLTGRDGVKEFIREEFRPWFSGHAVPESEDVTPGGHAAPAGAGGGEPGGDVRQGREKLHYLNPVPIHQAFGPWIRKFEPQRLRALVAFKRDLERRRT